MGSNWELLTLEEAGIILLDCVHKTPSEVSKGLPYVAIPDMKNGEIDLKSARKISPKHFEEWTKKANPQPFDIVLSRRCNPGETAYVRQGMSFALGQNLVLLRSNGKRVHPKFLRWAVRSNYWWEQIAKFLNVGAVFDSLRCADVPKFELPFPPIPEQEAIAAVLSVLDDKIELNRRMNETLEAMAKALFKSWFVDFDPVRAKAEGCPPQGLAPEIAALFPDGFEESELGEIPKGWRCGSIYEICEVIYGAPFKSELFNEKQKGLPLIRIRDLKTNSPNFWTEEENTKANVIAPGDVVVGMDAEFRAHFWMGQKAYLNQRLFYAKPKNASRFFVRETLIPLLEFEERAQVGTTVAHIGKKDIDKFKVIIATPAVLKAFNEFSDSILEKMVNVSQVSRLLTQIRDSLLPKLMSGEIRVQDAEAMAEAAL